MKSVSSRSVVQSRRAWRTATGLRKRRQAVRSIRLNSARVWGCHDQYRSYAMRSRPWSCAGRRSVVTGNVGMLGDGATIGHATRVGRGKPVCKSRMTTVRVPSAPMRIAMLASECEPFAKTGGLADVVDALARALGARGHEVDVYLPRYRGIAGTPGCRGPPTAGTHGQ